MFRKLLQVKEKYTLHFEHFEHFTRGYDENSQGGAFDLLHCVGKLEMRKRVKTKISKIPCKYIASQMGKTGKSF